MEARINDDTSPREKYINKGRSGKLTNKQGREKIRTVIGFEPHTCDI